MSASVVRNRQQNGESTHLGCFALFGSTTIFAQSHDAGHSDDSGLAAAIVNLIRDMGLLFGGRRGLRGLKRHWNCSFVFLFLFFFIAVVLCQAVSYRPVPCEKVRLLG